MEIKKQVIKGKLYIVSSGPYKGYVGKCVSIDDKSHLPIILQDATYSGRAVKYEEIDPFETPADA